MSPRRVIAAIAAVAANGVIGEGNRLPWHLPEDLARFKRLTMGGTLIMGRKTWDSIGHRPLPGRRIVVVSRRPGDAREEGAGVTWAGSIEEALEKAEEGPVWIAGGAEIYRLAMDRVDWVYLTRIEAEFPGDTFFPELERETWHLVEEERRPAGEGAPYPYRFEVWERRSPSSPVRL
jgi:dihydrofolate reductase